MAAPATGGKVSVGNLGEYAGGVGAAKVEQIQIFEDVEVAASGAMESASPFNLAAKNGRLGIAGGNEAVRALLKKTLRGIQPVFCIDLLDHIQPEWGKRPAPPGVKQTEVLRKRQARGRVGDDELVHIGADYKIIPVQQAAGTIGKDCRPAAVRCRHASFHTGHDGNPAARGAFRRHLVLTVEEDVQVVLAQQAAVIIDPPGEEMPAVTHHG